MRNNKKSKIQFYALIIITSCLGILFLTVPSMKQKMIGLMFLLTSLIIYLKSHIRKIIKIRLNKKISELTILVAAILFYVFNIYNPFSIVNSILSYILPLLIGFSFILVDEKDF